MPGIGAKFLLPPSRKIHISKFSPTSLRNTITHTSTPSPNDKTPSSRTNTYQNGTNKEDQEVRRWHQLPPRSRHEEWKGRPWLQVHPQVPPIVRFLHSTGDTYATCAYYRTVERPSSLSLPETPHLSASQSSSTTPCSQRQTSTTLPETTLSSELPVVRRFPYAYKSPASDPRRGSGGFYTC